MTAKIPTGRRRSPNEVPCASFWENPRKNTNAGTTMIPPPTPTSPLNIPAANPTMISNKIVSIFIFARLLFFTKLFFKALFIKQDSFFDDLEGGRLILEVIDLHFFIFEH